MRCAEWLFTSGNELDMMLRAGKQAGERQTANAPQGAGALAYVAARAATPSQQNPSVDNSVARCS